MMIIKKWLNSYHMLYTVQLKLFAEDVYLVQDEMDLSTRTIFMNLQLCRICFSLCGCLAVYFYLSVYFSYKDTGN